MIKLPAGVNIHNLIENIKDFSWEASETLLYYSQLLKDPNYKKNLLNTTNIDDPVTEADLKVNKIIIERINQKYRKINWGILSEENVKISTKSLRINREFLWVLDPLDGTKDFIQGTGNYAMHLALNYMQRALLGVVLIPEKNELWISDGKKVWSERRNGSKVNPRISSITNLNEMTVVTSKNHKNQKLANILEHLNFKKKVEMGSIGCKIASIVRGESDIYISLSLPGQSAPKDWDFAAPETILRSCGGAITNLENENLCYGGPNFEQKGIIVASNNKENHKKICLQIKNIIMNNNLYP